MLHAFTYSIVSHLETQIPDFTEVIWMRDGISLTDKVKPFATVEQMQNANESITTGRSDYEMTYRFQVGLFAQTESEQSKLQDTIKTVLLQTNIPFYDTRGPSPIEAGAFVADVTTETPMPVEDVTDETNKNRVYFDVEITIYRVNGEYAFTQ